MDIICLPVGLRKRGVAMCVIATTRRWCLLLVKHIGKRQFGIQIVTHLPFAVARQNLGVEIEFANIKFCLAFIFTEGHTHFMATVKIMSQGYCYIAVAIAI